MPLLLLLLIPVAFAMNPVIARALAADVEPGTLSLIRWTLSALVIGAIALARGKQETWRIADRDAAGLILLGALGFGFCSFAAYAGVRTTTATNVGLIYACTSAIVMLAEIVRGRIRPTLLLLAGVSACILGVFVILLQGDLTALAAFHFGVGEAWALAGTIVWAAYTSAMTGRVTGMTPLAQFTIMAAAGALACAVPTVSELLTTGPPRIVPGTLVWIATLIAIPSCGAFLGYNASIRINGGMLTAASLSLTPPAIAVMAITLISEDVRWYHVVAIVLVVLGLVLINFDRSRAAKRAAVVQRRAEAAVSDAEGALAPTQPDQSAARQPTYRSASPSRQASAARSAARR
jgi:drug/metabolite transporter (DMT)-like permease